VDQSQLRLELNAQDMRGIDLAEALKIGRAAVLSIPARLSWTTPSDHARVLKRLQQRRCAETGGRLWKTAKVDHRVPLFRVWGEHRDTPWPSLLCFWGVPRCAFGEMRRGSAVPSHSRGRHRADC
jgi:hypothetical protein